MFTKVQIGGVSFNDNTNYTVNGFAGLEMPATRAISYNLAGEHFGIFVSAFYGRRRWSLDGTVIGSTQGDFISKRDALQEALDALGGETTVLFTLANGRLLQIDAAFLALSFAPRPGVINAADFQAQFESAFPFLQGQTLNELSLFLPTGGGGKVPPDTMPMSLSYGSGGSIFPANNGNAPSYPTARINGPVTNPALRNEAIGRELQMNLTLASGEYVDLDFKRKTVTNHQGVNRYDAKSGDWWFLQPGTNEVKFRANTYDANAVTTFKFRDSYLGL